MPVQLMSIVLEPGGPTILAEVRDERADGGDAHSRAADPARALGRASLSVREALTELIVPSARVIVDGLKALSPAAVEIEFGLKLSAQAGVVLAATGVEGHFNVKLTWPAKPEPAPDGSGDTATSASA